MSNENFFSKQLPPGMKQRPLLGAGFIFF